MAARPHTRSDKCVCRACLLTRMACNAPVPVPAFPSAQRPLSWRGQPIGADSAADASPGSICCQDGTSRMTRVLHRVHRAQLSCRGERQRHPDPRCQRQGLYRCQRRRGGVVPRPRSSRRAGRHARSARQAGLCAHELLHDAGRRGTGRRPDRARAARHQPRLFRQRRVGGHRGVRSRWRGSTSWRRASRSAATSSPAGRAITATRWVRLAVGGNEWRRKQFAPLLIEVHHVSPCFEYRGRQAGRDAGAVRRATGPGARRQDRTSSAPIPSWPSWPKRSGARRPDAFRRSRATSSASARSATATACC